MKVKERKNKVLGREIEKRKCAKVGQEGRARVLRKKKSVTNEGQGKHTKKNVERKDQVKDDNSRASRPNELSAILKNQGGGARGWTKNNK